MFGVCDAGKGLSWMLAKRLRAFDAVYYTAPVGADTLTGADTDAVTADRTAVRVFQRLVGTRTALRTSVSETLMCGASNSCVPLTEGSPKWAHMADVVQNALDEGVTVGNASSGNWRLAKARWGARFSLVFPLTSTWLATHSELVVHRTLVQRVSPNGEIGDMENLA